MDLAISLAEDRVGLTGSNPSVGCVIVNKSQIISVGQTGIGGTPHAETVAIKSAKKKDLIGLLVSLGFPGLKGNFNFSQKYSQF